jgi:hypothetical protein
VGGKANSGPQSTNDQIVAMQAQQADQARNANIQRNARLNYGKNLVQSIFEGTPSGATTLDLSSIGASGNPPTADPNVSAALNWAYAHPDASSYIPGLQSNESGAKQSLSNGYSWGALPDTGGDQAYGIYDASGNLVTSANSLSDLASSKIYLGGDPNTKVGGFGDDFYNKFRQSILDYYNPQEGDQYDTARSDLSASLARAGQLKSTTATYDIGKLAKQDAINRAQIASGADTQTGNLRTTISQDEQSALNQLYSTEDPSVAANTAGNMVASANLTKPLLDPSQALFQPINVGVGTALTGFLNPTGYLNPNTGAASVTGVKDYGSNQTGYG